MRTGIATIPLDYGRCPRWLFERMKKLARGITIAIIEEFGPKEFLKRISDPVWFQSFGCVLGFDWNSSGLTTTTLGALKAGIFDIENELGIYICGGKGKTSRKTPDQILIKGEKSGAEAEKTEKLVYISKLTAKIDNSCLQDGFQIYHHNFIFSKSGEWVVVQQGMNEEFSRARRYHWFSNSLENLTEEPHSGIISDLKTKPLNLTARASRENKKVAVELISEEPNTLIRDLNLIIKNQDKLINREKKGNITLLELEDKEFSWHPVIKEKFNLNRLKKIINSVNLIKPRDFEELIAIKGVGSKTIRALSLVAEVIYGAQPSYEDPARYSFAHGGKDGTPYFVEKPVYDRTIKAIEKGIFRSKVSLREKREAIHRLHRSL